MSRYKNTITLPDIYDSQLEEKKIIKFWCKQQIFEKIRKSRREKNNGKFSFHSGPVFPTGFPHAGHIFNGIVKDVFTRYGHQKNLQVESRFGWDCHGLSVEHEVDKKLDVRSPEDIQKMGIGTYNQECRNFVQRHSVEWNNVFERAGNWVDFTQEYKTMDTEYMEGVWKVFKQLFDKGLVYRDNKVMPYSTACFTHLSNFEAQQNCKDVTESGMTISINIVDSEEKLLIWTTSPWTVLLNSAVCVNPESVYLKVKVGDKVYILAKSCLQFVFKNASEYTVLEELKGKSLHDLKYEPLFNCLPVRSDFQILLESCISDDIGTGIVPLGENPINLLKERRQVLNEKEVTYKRPYCSRSDTPLINKRVESWFIRVKAIAEDVLENISKVNWFPDYDSNEELRVNLKEDWAVSRTRIWGTPIPIWSSASGDEVVCVGSIEELKKLTGKTNITDLHRECVDWMVIPSRTPGNPPLRRVPEVFDCWFESGAMPFVLKESSEAQSSEVDFVAEGRDQTRGWFYTMLVLSTALSQPAFRNVYATGLALEPDGSKVSKRKHNRNDPMRLIEKYGADSLRLYILSIADGDFTIQEEGVVNIAKNVIEPLYRIFNHCNSQLGSPGWANYGYITDWYKVQNTIDHWILSSTESLLKFYDNEMKHYRPHTILPKVFNLIQQIEEWYIPIRRPEPPEHPATFHSTCVLFNVIYRLTLMLAPFAPLITEYIYQCQRLHCVFWLRHDSIHEAPFISPNEKLISPEIETRVARMQRVVEIVRALRTRHIVPIHYQINEVVVIHYSDDYLHDIELVKDTITTIINAHDIRVSKDHHEFGCAYEADLISTSAFRTNTKITAAVQGLKDGEIESLIQIGAVNILDHDIPWNDVQITYRIEKEDEVNCATINETDLIVVMKMNKRLSYYEEGTIKELGNRIRNLKKKGGYYPSDFAAIYFSTKDDCLKQVMGKHKRDLEKNLKCSISDMAGSQTKHTKGFIEETVDVKGMQMKMHLFSNCD